MLVLFLAAAAFSSACSTGRTNAQTPPKAESANTKKDNAETSKSTYQPPRKVSKDVIK